jgi:hypothetical protein
MGEPELLFVDGFGKGGPADDAADGEVVDS